MPNALLTRLGRDYNDLFARYDTILNRCHDENRDPDPSETMELEGLRWELNPLGERIVQLRDDENRRQSTVLALTPPGGIEPVSAPAGAPPGRRHPLPPLTVGDTQLSAIQAAIENRTAYNEPVTAMDTRVAAVTPAGAAVPVWWPPVEYGVEGRLAEAITTRPAPRWPTSSTTSPPRPPPPWATQPRAPPSPTPGSCCPGATSRWSRAPPTRTTPGSWKPTSKVSPSS
jgi:hypothetical protein